MGSICLKLANGSGRTNFGCTQPTLNHIGKIKNRQHSNANAAVPYAVNLNFSVPTLWSNTEVIQYRTYRLTIILVLAARPSDAGATST